jgi:methyl-accepting chemotaxis protein
MQVTLSAVWRLKDRNYDVTRKNISSMRTIQRSARSTLRSGTGGIIQGTLDANKAIQDAKNQFRVFLKGTAAEVETKLGEARHASTQLQDNFANVQKLLIGLSFTGLLIGAVILFTIPGSIARPITELTESVTDISKGNITRPVSVRGSHEVKALAESVERLRVAVKGLMTRMNKLQQRQNESKRQSFA